ncbi:MAG TPA: PadR family transcriptional regulator [Actinomycetota bacterium]|nr:PadR family transcriptional regulator [Actinomycetota bacterium]
MHGAHGPWHGWAGWPGRPPFFGPPGPWGHGPWPRAARGDVRSAILFLLAERPMHGYQVIQELTARSGGAWQPSPGSVYPTLQQLEDEGLVRSAERDGRRVFELTEAGRAEVERRKGEPRPWEVRGRALNGTAVRRVREEGVGLAAAVMQVVRTAAPEQVERAAEVLARARRELYRLLAEAGPAGGAGRGADEAGGPGGR